MKIRVITDNKREIIKRGIALYALISCLILLASCMSTTNHATLAPPPPEVTKTAFIHNVQNRNMNAESISRIEPAAGAAKAPQIKSYKKNVNCKAHERFDREDTLAYQWGRGERNRLAFDIDGLEFSPFGGSSAEIEKIRFEYSFKLQNFKSKKEKCKGSHNWQGLVGSGYRELIEREEDTIWDQVDTLQDELF